MNSFEVRNYFQRINYLGFLDSNKDVLFELQKAHLYSVPFENIDIYNDKWIDPSNSYNKVVNHRRGGFCYELNALFFDLLRSIGFNASLISACVCDDQGEFGPEFDHMAILVEINEENYLVDVGFGEFSLAPLKIQLNELVIDQRGSFRIREFEKDRLIVEKVVGRRVIPRYHFSLIQRKKEDFIDMCRFHQTDPSSIFKKNRLCSLPTPSGRITLTGSKLRITSQADVEQRTLQSEEEVTRVLIELFKMGEW
jgi:N-hydroxyarylamine O-acetyltransferase